MAYRAKQPAARIVRRPTPGQGAQGPYTPHRPRASLLTSTLLSSIATFSLAILDSTDGQAAEPAPRPLSPAWFAARGGATANTATTPQASVAAVRQSLTNLAKAATAVTIMQGTQSQARSAASALKFGNGIAPTALQPTNIGAWQNARAPVQSSTAGRTQVSVTQTAKKAILTWSSFNVGESTDLTFDQSAGGNGANTWVVLNRVTNPSAQPSQILGNIRAQGQVYILNQNGIIFGNSTQVNVGALLATTADFAGGNKGFSANGIYSAAGTAGLLPAFGGASDTDAAATSAIVVQAGAQITTASPSSVLNRGGFVTLLAGNVQNNGSIVVPQGQIALAAGQQFILAPGYSNSGSGDPLATTLGSQIAVNRPGVATNAGLLQANRGDITLVGHDVTQAGVALSTTTTSQRGTIHLLTDTTDKTARIRLAPGSLTQIAPEFDNSETALNSQQATLIAQSNANNTARLTAVPSLNNVAGLADRLDLSRIEITTGGAISFGAGSLTQAQAGQISVSANSGRITAASGATLDVSGAVGVSLPASDNILTVNIQPTQLRDSPANRDTGKLAGSNVYINANNLTFVAASVADTADRFYTPGGLLEVSGFVNNVGHTIGAWSTVGGNVTLAGGQVVVEKGASVNLAGGSLDYQSGLVNTTWLTGSNGHIYSAANAPAGIPYSGVYHGFSINDTKWNVSAIYTSPLVAPQQVFQPGFTVGRDAGTLILNTPTALVDGTIIAGVVTGTLQTGARPAIVSNPFALGLSVAPLGGTLAIGSYSATGLTGVSATDVVLGGSAATGYDPEGGVLAGRTQTAWLSGDLLNGSGLASLQISTGSSIRIAGPVTLGPGGQVSLTAPIVSVAADLSAPGGAVILGNRFSGDGTFLTANGAAAVSLMAGARIDASGMWNNRQVNAMDATGAGFIGGGSVTLDSSQGTSLAAGSTIDVSGGGTLSASSVLRGGKAGSVTLIADDPRGGTANAPLVLAGMLSGFGAAGSGTLSLSAPQVRIAAGGVSAGETLSLTPQFFQRGFSSYVVNGMDGLSVAPATTLNVVMPAYSRANSAVGLPTGANPADAYTLALAPLFVPNSATATVAQRGGASLALQSVRDVAGGTISIGSGAAITVDPGQSVALRAYGSIMVDGSITAPGGGIAIVNTRYQDGTDERRPSLYAPGLAVWLGASSSLNVSGISFTAPDSQGRPFGVVQNGGTIGIGGIGGIGPDGTLQTTDAQVIIRPGAMLLANGAHAAIDPAAGLDSLVSQETSAAEKVKVAGGGGIIALSSYTGIYADGRLRAAAGGPGAPGGTLSLTLETPIYNVSKTAPDSSLLVPRVLSVAQKAVPLLPTDQQEGAATPQPSFGRAEISAAQVTQGGFGTVALSSRGLILFNGDVSLTAAQSITLSNGILADSVPTGHVRIAAPYVRLSGDTSVTLAPADVSPLLTQNWLPPTQLGSASFKVRASQLDLVNDIRLGTGSKVSVEPTTGKAGTKTSTGYAGFAAVDLQSTGDLRFLAASGSVTNNTTLYSDGNIVLDAAQIYPASGAKAIVVAGYDYNAAATANPLLPGGKMVIGRTTAFVPDTPLSVGGSLTLAAGEIDQGGIVRAPLGHIALGVTTTATALVGFGKATDVTTTRVKLLDNGITSVSAAGLTLPYGGTSDGVSYVYNGGGVSTFTPTITLAGRSISGAAGAMLDLQGGGALLGGGGELLGTNASGVASLTSQGFIAGRGGSTDTLVTPLLQFNAASTTAPSATLASNPVYAIVPTITAGYAPITQLDQSASYYGSQPALGQQISIGAGVPGLAAGTYTLLPSYYALLPGGFRVELAPGHFVQPGSHSVGSTGGATAFGYRNYQVAANLSVADTSVKSALAVTATIMPGTDVRSYSQYDEQSFSAFQIAQAATYNRVRPLLAQDAGTLVLSYPSVPLYRSELAFDGLANFSPGDSGYGGTLVVTAGLKSAIEITGANGPVSTRTVAIDSAALNRFGAPRLVIGGTTTYSPGSGNTASQPSILLTASVGSVKIDAGASLTAADVFLLASSAQSSGAITIGKGATINTIGRGSPAYDSAGTGLPYDVQRFTALLASNGQISLASTNLNQRSSSGPLDIADGATILASGSLVTSTESSVSIGAGAVLGAAYLTLSVPVVSIGAPANVPVPNGLSLDQSVLARLLGGDPASGAPALRSLQITASGAVDFYGSVNFTANDISDGLQLLRLDTPAIYGQGGPGDVARLSVNTLVWNGVAGSGSTPFSVLPQGVVAGGAGTGQGALDIETSRLIFGYADGILPTQQVSLDRVIYGFSTVTLGAKNRIEFNNTGTLSVYARQSGVGPTGSPIGAGGGLTLSSPMITGASGASLAIKAGSALTLASAAAPVTTPQAGQGATLALTAPSVEIATTLAMNAGRIAITATGGDVQLNAGSRLDVSGPSVQLFDQVRGSAGGTVALESRTGNVLQAAGALIDVSASLADAGTISVTAPGGRSDLFGRLNGQASDSAAGGRFALRTGALVDFDGLNATLDTGGFTASRSFDIASGDLAVAGIIRAHTVAITASGGSLSVLGTIDASGARPGSITLAARDALTLGSGALLDAHGATPQTDSSGNPIEAANRADVSLTAVNGLLTLQGGATIDVSNATAQKLGTVELYAARRSSNDIAIDATASQTVIGASSVELYGMRSLARDNGTLVQSDLDSANTDNATFVTAATTNPALLARLAGIKNVPGFHLRPGVAYTSTGDLTVSGDLDLDALRTTGLSGGAALEPGALLLRAAGKLNIFGSITDGFGRPVDTTKPNPDDNGWILLKGVEPLGQGVVVPTEISLASGTTFDTSSGAALTYPVRITGGNIRAGVPFPGPATLSGSYRIGVAGLVATSPIRDSRGRLLFTQGALIPAGTVLSNVSVAAGAILPFNAHVANGTVWPAGAPLSGFAGAKVTLAAVTIVPAGGLIPAGTKLIFTNPKALSIALRTPVNGVQGSVLATAPLDAIGRQSWSIRLVGGANLASADTGAVRAASVLAAAGTSGDILLSDLHYVNPNPKNLRSVQPGISVIRTGTGDLSLLAGGSISEASLYGVYTAGTQSTGIATGYQLPRGTGFDTNGQILSTDGTGGYNYNNLLSGYSAWYPTGGGNVLVSAQGNVTGDVLSVRGNGVTAYQSDAVGNWLWRQGGNAGQSTAWWINFGAYVNSTDGSNTLQLAGFTGIGALGGGNVRVVAGGNAGNLAVDGASLYATTALDVVTGGTGRVSIEPGTQAPIVTLTGGGNVDVSVAGTLNPANTSFSGSSLGNALFGVLGAMRGTLAVDAGAIGAVVPSGQLISSGPLVQAVSDAHGGPLLLLGDATAKLAARGDLVLGGVIDPTRVPTANTTPWTGTINGVPTSEPGGGRASFSLWAPNTAISLASAGGTLVPTLDIVGPIVGADMNILYPGTLRAVAATGNIIYASVQGSLTSVGPALELAPSAKGQLELLAGGGINAAGLSTRLPLAIDISGADPSLISSPLHPAFQGTYQPAPGSQDSVSNVTNALNFAGPTSLFAFAADTPTGQLHANDPVPARIYAADGDIVDLNFGETWRFVAGSSTLATWYIAAKPALILASRDVINAGTAGLLPVASASDPSGLKVTRNLILNNQPGDASVVSAGRDIFYANFDIAGPGNLEVTAGRNLYQADQGSLYSLGQIVGANTSQTGGAGILLMSGLAQNPADWAALQALYLGTVTADAAGLGTFVSPSVAGGSQTTLTYQTANSGGGQTITVINTSTATAPGTLSATVKRNAPAAGGASSCVLGLVICDNHSIPGATPIVTVARSYDEDLVTWLTANAAFTAPPGPAPAVHAAALRAFAALPLYQRIPLLMQIYYSELGASGLEYQGGLLANDARYTATSSGRLSSYARGREANAILEPDPIVASPATSTNGITLFGGSGVSTAFGGSIEAFAPGGRLVLGLSSQTPPPPAKGQPAAGLITFGSGDIDISTYGSVLLGQSRIFTTFGGAINIWSEGGDINAGTGSKTTSVYQPPKIAYDSTGDITLSPSAPTSGAGIATLAPVAGVPAGDVVLAVELGVIDTGEAGIRSSGRIALAGTVVGNGGVTAASGTVGAPSVSVPSVGALSAAAGASAGASASANSPDNGRRNNAQGVPSIITVEVVSFGGDTFQ